MSKIEFSQLALINNAQVVKTTALTHSETLSEKQGWKLWREEGGGVYFAQVTGGPVNELPTTSVRVAIRKVVVAPVPVAVPTVVEVEQAEVVIETPKEILAAKPEVAKPVAKSKLPPRRGSAPVAES